MESEGIKIKFDDGREFRLPDISYEKFTEQTSMGNQLVKLH